MQAPSPAGYRAAAPVLWLLLPAIVYYAVLLTGAGSVGLFSPVVYGLNFNSMLLHLLHGRFDVDPAAIGYEGYLRNGAVYSYFGIFPALLRAPLLLLHNFANIDFTRVSCLVADSSMALFKLLSALVVWRSAASKSPVLLMLVATIILFSGPQVQFLRPSIYQEVLLWADALAAVFVLLVLIGWSRDEGFTVGLMSGLAVAAGLCLLTKVSTGLGLYVAVGLIWTWRVWQTMRQTDLGEAWPRLRALCLPPLVLIAFAVATGMINQQRWGNPFVFIDLTKGLMIPRPNVPMAKALADYGDFNPIRLAYGIQYYFFPLWIFRDGFGQFLWSSFTDRTMIDVELPPSSFLISDPLLVGLAIYGAARLVRPTGVPGRMPLALSACGLVIPAVLMLIAIAMTFRYRLEFYPLFELCAFVGFWCLLAAPRRRIGIAIGGAALVSVVAAPILWLLYMLSPFGTASDRLGQSDVVGFYECLLHRCAPAPLGSTQGR